MSRVLLVPAGYAPLPGGVQTVAAHLAVGLQTAAHTVRVLTQRHPRTLPGAETLDGIAVRRLLFLLPRSGYLRRGRLDLFAAGLVYAPLTRWRLARLLRTFRPEVVNIHYVGGITPFVLAAARNVPLVVTLHGYDVEGWAQMAPFERRVFRAALRRAAAVTAPTQALLDAAARLVPEATPKLHLTPNGVDVTLFRDAAPYPWPRPYILGLGRLVRTKGFDTLLDAYATLPLGVDLILAGEGEEATVLRAQAIRLGLDGRVHLPGRVDPPTAAALLAGARLLAIPSRREPFGLVALEGLAAGVPIVATAVGGLGELLAPTGSRLVPPEQPDALAAALAATLADLTRPSPAALSDWTWPAAVARYEKIYRACLRTGA